MQKIILRNVAELTVLDWIYIRVRSGYWLLVTGLVVLRSSILAWLGIYPNFLNLSRMCIVKWKLFNTNLHQIDQLNRFKEPCITIFCSNSLLTLIVRYFEYVIHQFQYFNNILNCLTINEFSISFQIFLFIYYFFLFCQHKSY